jgi:hypothetical protein
MNMQESLFKIINNRKMKRNETAYELAMDDLTMGVHETIPTTTLFTIVKEM